MGSRRIRHAGGDGRDTRRASGRHLRRRFWGGLVLGGAVFAGMAAWGGHGTAIAALLGLLVWVVCWFLIALLAP
jgi:hypothetical protein